MKQEEQIKAYIASQPAAKQADMQQLDRLIQKLMPGAKRWFLDGRDETGKIVSNPNIGYGSFALGYADGSTKEFYQIGMSSNTSGISVYIMGLKDRKYLATQFGASIGKAVVTGYCIRFKSVKDINQNVLVAAIRYGLEATTPA